MNIIRFIDVITESAANYPHGVFSRKGMIYTCVNPFSYHIVRKNYDIYNQMDGLFVDGILMCKMIHLLWHRPVPRLSFDMSGMAVDLFQYLNEINNIKSIFFIGAREDELNKSIKQISSAYPRMKILGYRSGYFTTTEDRTNTIRDIINIDADFTIIGMGAPIQEQFSIDLKNAGYGGIIFTCGGFLHQTSKRINYYPDWINKYNLRAIYRLFHEKNLWGRLYNVVLEFPVLFIYDTISAKFKSRK